MTALGLWTLFCSITVFLVLISYAIILIRDQMIRQGVLLIDDEGEALEETQSRVAWAEVIRNQVKGGKPATVEKKRVKEKDKMKKHIVLELSLFLLIFATFCCFNVYYWTGYLSGSILYSDLD